MTTDERLIPARAGRELDRPLSDLTQAKGYDRYGGGTVSETNLRDYFFVILKRKWLILSVMLVITSMAAIQQYRQPSIYEGQAELKIEEKPPNILSTSQVVITQRDPNFWGTQLKLLQNTSLADQVIATLDLQHNPNFLGGKADSGLFNSLKRVFSRDRKAAAAAPAASSGRQLVGQEEMKERELTAEERVALEPYEDAIITNEEVETVEKTNLVKVRYRHTDPTLAQNVANTLVEVFANNNQEQLGSKTKRELTNLGENIAKYQRKVEEERAARFNHAKQYNLPLEKKTDVEGERLNTYSKQLLDAENERRKLKSEYEAAVAGQQALSNPEEQKDDSANKLRETLTTLEAEKAALLQIYKPEWPKVKEIDAKIGPVKKAIEEAQRSKLAMMKSRLNAAESTEKSLTSAFAKQHGKTTEQTQHEIELAVLTQQLTSDEQYLNTLTQKERELRATGSGSDRGTNLTISSFSRLPHEPISPNRPRNILIALVLSLLAGIGLAFLLDFLDDTVKSLDDIDRYIHLPTLALIPAARSDKRLKEADATATAPSTALAMVEDDARSYVAEAYRHLRTSLLLSSAGQAPKTILITSSQPSEGKTTTAINTAFMLAQTGAEVLILDCDLRRPRLHSNFNISNARGVTNYLSGELPIEEVIQPYEKLPNLKLLPSGPIPPNPAELLGSEQMRKLLATLSEKFAHIIVDSPPAVSFTDASILSAFVDGVILVIHSGRSSRAVVRRAKQQLLDVGAHIFGIVLNNVKLERHGYYYGGYYGRYYYKYGYGYYYSDYYGEDDRNKAPAASS